MTNESVDEWEKDNKEIIKTIENLLADLESHPEKKKCISELSRKATAEAMKEPIGREMQYHKVQREMARQIGK